MAITPTTGVGANQWCKKVWVTRLRSRPAALARSRSQRESFGEARNLSSKSAKKHLSNKSAG